MGVRQSRTIRVRDFFAAGDVVHAIHVGAEDTIASVRDRLAAVSKVPIHRQRVYHLGKRVTGLESFDLSDQDMADFVLLRLPAADTPSNKDVFEGGDLKRGKINVKFLIDLFEHEGKLSIEQAEAIITRAKDILTKEPSLINVQE
jgi:hypothetical protein